MERTKTRVAIFHGAGYVGGELIRLLDAHPDVSLHLVTSRSFAGRPVWQAHPALRGTTELTFTSEENVDLRGVEVVFSAAEHGKGAASVLALLKAGYDGAVIDLSADFRFADASLYESWFGFRHPAPELIPSFIYGLPEIHGPHPSGSRYVANPGCFATALALALHPPAAHLAPMRASVTALTGASGSGARPTATTHFPTRAGNVRAYKVLRHQHLPEVLQVLGSGASVAFVPVSGPWTRGIWGTAHVELPEGVGAADVTSWFHEAYGHCPFVRLWEGELPELRYAVDTPFCDLGWIVERRALVVGFAIDNLLKGAASQAVQNMNLLLGLPETAGLLSAGARRAVEVH